MHASSALDTVDQTRPWLRSQLCCLDGDHPLHSSGTQSTAAYRLRRGAGLASPIKERSCIQCYDDNTNCNQQPNFVPLDFKSADNGNHAFFGLCVTLGPSPGQIRTIGSVHID
jgi:hypothetical protein